MKHFLNEAEEPRAGSPAARSGRGRPAEQKYWIAFAAAAVLCAAPGYIATAAQETKPSATGSAPIWTVRPTESSLGFKTKWSQGPVEGRFEKWNAAIAFDPNALGTSSATVTIDMASVKAGDADAQGALPESDWFSVAVHPTATFNATSFRHLSGDQYEAIGTLAIRGVSRPLTLPFTLSIAGDVATMNGAATIDRTSFGVGQGDWSATNDVVGAVTISVSLTADRRRT